jgi:hypothetical protein
MLPPINLWTPHDGNFLKGEVHNIFRSGDVYYYHYNENVKWDTLYINRTKTTMQRLFNKLPTIGYTQNAHVI